MELKYFIYIPTTIVWLLVQNKKDDDKAGSNNHVHTPLLGIFIE